MTIPEIEVLFKINMSGMTAMGAPQSDKLKLSEAMAIKGAWGKWQKAKK